MISIFLLKKRRKEISFSFCPLINLCLNEHFHFFKLVVIFSIIKLTISLCLINNKTFSLLQREKTAIDCIFLTSVCNFIITNELSSPFRYILGRYYPMRMRYKFL